jgi:DNA replication and repair protein RecF
MHRLGLLSHAEAPLLLLDDVFSELDGLRSRALLEQLPPGQTLLTTASDPPDGVSPERVVRVTAGHLLCGTEIP